MAVRYFLSPVSVVAIALALYACSGTDDDDASQNQDAGPDAAADTDADTDTDTDTDSDSDADTDTYIDAGTPEYTATWVAAGYTQTCAVVEGGDVKCWGYGMFGELGYGHDLDTDSDADHALPSTLPFVRVGGEVAQIEAGINTTCALLVDGGVKCWGAFAYGDLGIDDEDGIIGLYDVPADHEPIYIDDTATVQLDIGGGHMCAVLDTGVVRCFGDGVHGETAGGTVSLGSPAVHVCTGVAHSCAVLENGDVYCWGAGAGGVLGYGDTDMVTTPSSAGPVDIGGAATQVACGYYHTCALLDTGEVVCWGSGEYGQLGYGDTDKVGDDEVPAYVGPVDVGASATQITAGSHHTCAVIEGGKVKCWGQGASGALGYGNPDDVGVTNVPADVGTIPVGAEVVRIDAGQAYNCVLTTLGGVICWGTDSAGNLGYGFDSGPTYIGDDETPASMGYVPLL